MAHCERWAVMGSHASSEALSPLWKDRWPAGGRGGEHGGLRRSRSEREAPKRRKRAIHGLEQSTARAAEEGKGKGAVRRRGGLFAGSAEEAVAKLSSVAGEIFAGHTDRRRQRDGPRAADRLKNLELDPWNGLCGSRATAD